MLSVEFITVPLTLYNATENIFFPVVFNSSFDNLPSGFSKINGNHFPIKIPFTTVERHPKIIGIIK